MRRMVLAVVAVALATVVTVAPAGATGGAMPREDATHDAVNAKGDVVSSTYSANFTDIFLTGFKLKVTTLQGANPTTTPAWFATTTQLRAFLDVTNHAGADLLVVLAADPADPHTFEASVSDLTGGAPVPVPCTATATFTAPNVYKGTLGPDCFAGLDPIRVRERVALLWDTPPSGGTTGTDKAPDSGWGSQLVAPPPP